MKTLGEADAEGDDLGAWISKSRKQEEKRKAKEREAALKMARQLEQQVQPLTPRVSLRALFLTFLQPPGR